MAHAALELLEHQVRHLRARLEANWTERDDLLKRVHANEWESTEIARQVTEIEDALGKLGGKSGQPVSAP